MRGQFYDPAEIIDGANQAGAEQVMPDAIDHHARGQRIVRAGDALRQFAPATSRRCKGLTWFREHFKVAARRRSTGFGTVTASEDRLRNARTEVGNTSHD